jgi:hypothetical protein
MKFKIFITVVNIICIIVIATCLVLFLPKTLGVLYTGLIAFAINVLAIALNGMDIYNAWQRNPKGWYKE